MFAHETFDEVAVGAIEAHALADRARDGCALRAVVTRACDLADVVQQRGDEEQVGPCHVLAQARRDDDGLDAVSVDGELVDRVSLRARTHRRPLGQPDVDDAAQIEALPHVDDAGPAREEPHETLPDLSRPRGGQRPAARDEVREGRRPDERTPRGRRSGGAQQRQVPAVAAPRAEDDLAVVQVQPVPERRQRRSARPDAQRPGSLRLAGRAHGRVRHVRDRARRVDDARQQLVAVGAPEQRRDGVLILQAEPLPTPPGDDVQRVAHVEQLRSGAFCAGAVRVGEPRRRQRADEAEVAQASPGFLEVRIERRRDVTETRVPRPQRLDDLRQPLARGTAPVGGDRLAYPGDEDVVTGHGRDVEHADRSGEV